MELSAAVLLLTTTLAAAAPAPAPLQARQQPTGYFGLLVRTPQKQLGIVKANADSVTIEADPSKPVAPLKLVDGKIQGVRGGGLIVKNGQWTFGAPEAATPGFDLVNYRLTKDGKATDVFCAIGSWIFEGIAREGCQPVELAVTQFFNPGN